MNKNLSNELFYIFWGQNSASVGLFEVNRFFRKIKKIWPQLKSIFFFNFFDFSKKLVNFKKAHRSRILSPEAVKQFTQHVFVHTPILKFKKNSPGILNPSNPLLNGAQKRVFSNFQKFDMDSVKNSADCALLCLETKRTHLGASISAVCSEKIKFRLWKF